VESQVTLSRLAPNTIFASDYRVVEPLAEGGMGSVYVVEQVSTMRRRALKVMLPQLVSDPKSRERFTREATVASQVESDHIVEVLAAGVDEGTRMPFLVMELLSGRTLAERVEQDGACSLDETIAIVTQMGHALAAAHHAGIVHRDLKPENVFLTKTRRSDAAFMVKLLDFGIAS
jgi:eukaryotic-like serine/threonine-protein kinase